MADLRRAADEGLEEDEVGHLLRAVDLGRRGWGSVHPNPMVGCVLVRDGEEVGRGWHQVFGGPHAEVEALRSAPDEAVRGSTAFVSLEPCRHVGKTPACTVALREAGVRRVVYGAADPTREAGGGGDELRRSGLDVLGPVFARALARGLDPAFFHLAESGGMPYVAAKLAMSLDGMIAAGEGERTAVTGPLAQRYTHRLRAGFDAILVGAGTVRVDDPLLTVRGDVQGRTATHRLIVDTHATALTPESALLRDVNRVPVHLFCLQDAPGDRVRALEAAGVRVHRVPKGPGGVELEEVLRVCRQEGMTSILCEGGARLAGGLLERSLVHRMYLYVAPNTLGPDGVPAFPDGLAGDDRGSWQATASEHLGRDILTVLDREKA